MGGEPRAGGAEACQGEGHPGGWAVGSAGWHAVPEDARRKHSSSGKGPVLPDKTRMNKQVVTGEAEAG